MAGALLGMRISRLEMFRLGRLAVAAVLEVWSALALLEVAAALAALGSLRRQWFPGSWRTTRCSRRTLFVLVDTLGALVCWWSCFVRALAGTTRALACSLSMLSNSYMDVAGFWCPCCYFSVGAVLPSVDLLAQKLQRTTQDVVNAVVQNLQREGRDRPRFGLAYSSEGWAVQACFCVLLSLALCLCAGS